MDAKIQLQDAMSREQRLMLLTTQYQRQIFSYIYALVPDRHDAQDLLQETNLVIVEKFDAFEPGTDFVAWACQIAWWRVRASRQKFARSKVVFDDNVLEAVAHTAATMTEEISDRHDALNQCLQKLHRRDRDMIVSRYEPGGGVEEAAKASGRSLVATYKALGRIRKLLLDCVSNQLMAAEAT